MAKIPTRKPPRYKTPRVKRPPRDPALPKYRPMTPAQIDETALAQATGQVQPTLDELSAEGRTESGAHLARSQDLNSWYAFAADQAAKNFGSLSGALQGLQTTAGTQSQQAQDALAAAIRGDQGAYQQPGGYPGGQLGNRPEDRPGVHPEDRPGELGDQPGDRRALGEVEPRGAELEHPGGELEHRPGELGDRGGGGQAYPGLGGLAQFGDQGAIGGVRENPDVLAAAAANAATNRTSLAGLSAAQLGNASARQNLIPIELTSLQGDETRHHEGINADLTGRRREAAGQIGTLAKGARADLVQQDFERKLAVSQLGEQRANRLFQQYMSEKQFGLQAQNLSFQQWLGEQGLNLDVAQLGEATRSAKAQEGLAASQQAETHRANVANEFINQEQVTNDAAKTQAAIDQAATQDEKDRAIAAGKRHTAGVQALSAYLTPTKNEIGAGGRLKRVFDAKGHPIKGQTEFNQRVNYDQAIRTLYAVGISPLEARQIIGVVATMPEWRARAQREAQHIRLRRKGPSGSPLNPRPQGPGAGAPGNP